ncbi:MAG TPA: Hint domain-containing protein [Stellaceae bacterium]|nr:Hint domain-containing protein [Stellaceae bacterium]
MPSKYLSGTYTPGYTLSSAYTSFTIGTAGVIGGVGLVGGSIHAYTVINLGAIAGGGGTAGSYGYGIGGAGGPGSIGVTLAGGDTVANFATIAGGQGGNGGNSYHRGGAGGAGGAGIILASGGSIGNSGRITGGQGGIGGYANGIFGTYYGGNGGSGGVGIDLAGGGSVTNSGTIAGGQGGSGGYGFFRYGSNGTAGSGIVLAAGGSVTNGSADAAAEVIAGQIGVAASGTAGATVTDYGTISGSGGVAVSFAGSGANLLALGNGYKLLGTVAGSAAGGASNALELLGAAGNAVSVNYAGLGLTNFSDVRFGPGGNATLLVSNVSGTFGGTLSGFGALSDRVDLTAIGSNGAITNNDTVNHLVTISGSSGNVTFHLDTSDGSNFTTAPDGGAGTALIACFCRGTRILTPAGEVAVETLAAGDMVVTRSGEAKPVRWIGRRAYDGRFIAGNANVLPIRIVAGALAPGVPARDLFVSPGHALYLDGVLALAEHLVNGATIIQAGSVEQIEYFHIELDAHAIIFADGAPTESYVDCGNRMMFANGADYAPLHPDDNRLRGAFCAARLERDAAELTAIRKRLLERAAAHGHALATDPDLHLVVDGAVIRPAAVAVDAYRFLVPAGSVAVWLCSRRSVPAEVDAGARDLRRLGVPVERLALYDGEMTIEARHGNGALHDGFHADEGTHRWTDGMARIPDAWLRHFRGGGLTLDVRLAGHWLAYRFEPRAAAETAAV